MVPDDHVAVLAPHLVNYGFVRYLMRNDWKVIEVPLEEYWGLAVQRGHARARQGRDERRLADRRRAARAGTAIEVIQVDFSESHNFAIAGLHCATLELVRDQPDD